MIIVANLLGTLELSPILVPYDLALSQNNSVFSFPVWLQSGNRNKEKACACMYMLAEFSGYIASRLPEAKKGMPLDALWCF